MRNKEPLLQYPNSSCYITINIKLILQFQYCQVRSFQDRIAFNATFIDLAHEILAYCDDAYLNFFSLYTFPHFWIEGMGNI